jgi:hypothetical protein
MLIAEYSYILFYLVDDLIYRINNGRNNGQGRRRGDRRPNAGPSSRR